MSSKTMKLGRFSVKNAFVKTHTHTHTEPLFEWVGFRDLSSLHLSSIEAVVADSSASRGFARSSFHLDFLAKRSQLPIYPGHGSTRRSSEELAPPH